MSNDQEISKYTGVKRILMAFVNSHRAIKWMLSNEAAFRQEALLLLVSIPIAAYLDVGLLAKTALISVMLLVLIVETLNTGIEAAIDRMGDEYHELSGLAKDCGSAAVLLSFSLAAVVWIGILVQRFG